MATIDRLLKYLNIPNIATLIDEDKLKQIAEDVIKGYEIDEESRQDWLEINKEAMDIIKNADGRNNVQKNFPFEDAAKLVFPLLAPATIQLAARLISHIVRNDKTVEFKVLGQDTPLVNPQTGQPIPGRFTKQDKANRVAEAMNYELLIKSKSWLRDTQKAMHVVSAWGIAFKEVYYDYVTGEYCSNLIPPENVVVNQNVSGLEKAPRITIKHYLTKNEIIEQIRYGYFLDLDLDKLSTDPSNDDKNDSEEKQPVYEFLCQTCYIDLDDDDYLEPYKVYVHKESKQVYCIIPAFEMQDIDVDEKGKLKRITRRLDIVDFHAIDDPEGGYYSIGLNYLLLHPNKALTAIQRQLIDAGTLSNAAAVSGFVTKAFKTKERAIRIRLGEFPVLDCNPNVDPTKQIIPMPFREPSQVLLNMFQLLIDVSKNSGFLNDILTGDVEMQNVPATTTLAMTEQATRAFKPMIQKLYMSLKEEFRILFHLHSKYASDDPTDSLGVAKADFDEQSLDIVPVADPTQSSDAFKYARQRALIEAMPVFGQVTNLQQAALRYYTDMGFSAPETMIQTQPQQPDPKIMEVQLKAQIEQQKIEIQKMQLSLQQRQVQNQEMQTEIKNAQTHVKAIESGSKSKKLQADAVMAYGNLDLQQQQIEVNKAKVAVEADKVQAMREANRNKPQGE